MVARLGSNRAPCENAETAASEQAHATASRRGASRMGPQCNSDHNEAVYPQDKGISGRKFVPWLGLGFLIFTIVGLLGTYLAATAFTHFTAPHTAKQAR